jgi:gamma-glutamylcyclotransferase (GGCT)/AIG2-like uncharacterized protein YtfP
MAASRQVYNGIFDRTGKMRHLFAYGTLMCDDVMQDVSGLQMTGVPAVLQGYRRLRVKGEHYPAIVPAEASAVDGVVYQGIPNQAWILLDRFEGDMCVRETVRIALASGAALLAETYVMRAGFNDYLEETEWDFSAFLRDGKESFCKSYKRYDR